MEQHLKSGMQRKFETLSSGSRRPRAFRKVQNWLLQEQYLDQLLRSTPLSLKEALLPDFCVPPTFKGRLKLLKYRRQAERYIGNTSAQAIRVHNNMRAFYIPAARMGESQPFCAKILLSGVRDPRDMQNEVRVRRHLAALDTVFTPEILWDSLESEPIYFCEKLVRGRLPHPSKDADRICSQVVPQMAKTYEKHGISYKPVTQVVNAERMHEKIVEAMHLIDWNDQWSTPDDFLSAVSTLLNADEMMPCSLGHGDLSLQNMIVSKKGEIYLTDWEMSRELPIVFDMYKLMTAVPTTQVAVRTLLETVARGHSEIQMLSFNRQLFLSSVERIHSWESVREFLSNTGREKANSDNPSKLTAILTQQFQRANELLNQL